MGEQERRFFHALCYAVGAEKALLQAVLRVCIWRGKGFIPYSPKPRFYCVTNPKQRSYELTGTVSYWTTETNAYVRSSFPIRFSASGSGLRCFPPTGCSMRSFTRQGIRRNVPSAARSLRQPLTVSNTAPSAGSVSPADKPPSA